MNVDPKRVVTGKVRLSYVHLINPRAQTQEAGAKLKYSITLLIPKSDVATRQRIDAAINAAIQEGITSRWNGARPAQPPIPIHDGDGLKMTGEAFGEECKGHWVMTATSEQKPEVVDANLNAILNATEIYSGMYARVSVRFYAYFNTGKKGIGCGLGNVQKTDDGEPLAGRASASEDFGGGYQPAAPQYQPPMQQPVYGQPVPAFPQAPVQQPIYQPTYPQQPVYGQPQQPMYVPQPVPAYPAVPQQFDPVTGKPVVGGIMGI